MSKSLGEATLNFMVCPEKLVGEVLGHEGKHQIGSLGVWPKCVSFKETLSHHFGIRKDRFTCKERNILRFLRSKVTRVYCKFSNTDRGLYLPQWQGAPSLYLRQDAHSDSKRPPCFLVVLLNSV